ncbi:MAG: hypothetical protein ABSG68_00050 [Thermoguttaceae bacterium]|jgi:hypothetical protein
MKRRLGLAAVCWLIAVSPALAQFWPGRGYGGYGALGGYPAGVYNGSRLAAGQERQLGQEAAMGQNLVVQSGIRSTAMNQAQERSSAILDQRQADTNWWRQVQQQQMAQQQARPSSAVPVAVGFGTAPAAGSLGLIAPRPTVATDIIQWPPTLQEREFASSRAEVEAPYRRSPPGLSTPTTNDYRNMAKAVEDMKAILQWRTGQGGLATEDYQQAREFLNRLGQEVGAQADG